MSDLFAKQGRVKPVWVRAPPLPPLKMIKLKEIFKKISSDLKEDTECGYDVCNNLSERNILETYSLLAELRLNLNNHYEYFSDIKGMFVFTDKNDIQHFIRLVKENDRWEVKIGFFENNSTKPNYNRPNIYNNFEYDENIFNTHLKILFDELFPYFFENKLLTNDEKVLYFPALDVPRYRLYKISFTKFVDKNKYELKFYPKDKMITINRELL